MEEIESDNRYLINFRFFYLVTQVIGIIIIILVASWVGIHLGGLSWTENPAIQFNWHPILMTLGMIILYGNGTFALITFKIYLKKS